MMMIKGPLPALWLSAFLLVSVTCVRADDAVVLPANILFATSTGYWEGDADTPKVERAPSTLGNAPAAISDGRHGYYKLYAVRQPDRTAKMFLQQIAQTDDGPQIVSTVELEEISALKPYVTDIRPENTSGQIKEPGLFATIYLKTDPAAEPEGWTVLIDEFGEISIEKASN